jgi:hypothetical protein
MSFVQNHPYDESRVIVYTAPEGDEVATYTRGSARLVDGEVRVALGKTFAWVTNPDLGLTAHVTPRSPDAVVYVESVSTGELVVRNVTGFPDDAAFDYLVYGLRIGFEERAVVRPKKRESFIPSMAEDRGIFEQEPGLRALSALERFKAMHAAVSLTDSAALDLSASRSLREAVHEYDPVTDPPVAELLGHGTGRHEMEPQTVLTPERPALDTGVPPEHGEAIGIVDGGAAGETVGDEPSAALTDQPVDPDTLFPVAGPVEFGDLLALDPERPGMLVRATTALDTGVVGIAADVPVEADGVLRGALVDTNYAEVKVDAGYGEIRAGDLLTSSYTPGHAMRALEIVPGTIIGKALEPLESGTGLIRVLVMPR